MAIATGCPQLDRLLRGGIPEQRSVLVSGGPGVGKSTLAMQFLQEGLNEDEQCLYISTEQTTEEMRSSFAPFQFDLSHPNLTVTSIHATPETTLEESNSGLALKTLQGDETIDGPYTYPFEGEYIVEFLGEYAPCDRVVLDSASGLAAVSQSQERFRRIILDLIRLFTDTFEATTIFTAESIGSAVEGGRPDNVGSSDVLQFTTNGVIQLWWENFRGSRRRFLQVVKMRGVDHDTRNYEVGFSDRGIHLTPRTRTSDAGFDDDAIISTGVDGLDRLCGGLVRGHSVLVEYDGRALIDNLVAHMMQNALSQEMSVWFFPSPIMGSTRVQRFMPADIDLTEMLERDRLFVLDMFGSWKEYYEHRNVFHPPNGVLGSLFRGSTTVSAYLMKRMAKKIKERRDDDGMMGTVYTESFLRWLEPSQVKEVYYWAREDVAADYDTGFWVHNPATMDEQLAEFFHSDAVQVFEATMAENGIQYLHLNKSPVGQPGQTGVIDFRNDELVVSKV